MNSEQHKDLINLQDEYLNNLMDVRRIPHRVEANKLDYRLGSGKSILTNFSSESVFLLLCLTVSLIILPLVLPPLPPPPPFMLLLLPIFVLAMLILLAFMPSGLREVAHNHA